MSHSGDNILACDLDGTLIPLEENPDQIRDLQKLGQLLQEKNVPLIYVTGRHLESVEEARKHFQLPPPSNIICDVGSTICERTEGGRLEPMRAYQEYQKEIVADHPREWLVEKCERFDGLRMQEDFKQGPFKLSYYADQRELPELEKRLREMLNDGDIAWNLICSVDPFNGDGLVDFLPKGVSKAHALQWWAEFEGIPEERIVFAGDSGNDFAAFVAGFRAILVQNTAPEIVEKVAEEHRRLGFEGRMYYAKLPASSGVLEGCRKFGII